MMKGIGSEIITCICLVLFIGWFGDSSLIEKYQGNIPAVVVQEINRESIFDQIDEAVAKAESSNLNIRSLRGNVKLLGSNQTVSSEYMQRIIAEAKGTDGFYIYSSAGDGAYALIAPDIKGDFHLAQTYLEGYEPFSVKNKILPMYVIAKKKTYQLDRHQYFGREEVWQSSRQAFAYPNGDCEDHALLLADWLMAMGLDARVVVGDYDGGGHAWVVLFSEGKEFLLEATKKHGMKRLRAYPLAVSHTSYHPEYMFNREGFWENTGSKYTVNYSSASWVKKSTYQI